MIETVRRISRNVKHWSSGDMCLRWTAAGMLEAEAQFRKIIGHTDLAKLAVAVERDVAATAPTRFTRRSRPRRRRSPPRPPGKSTDRIAVSKFHGERDIIRRWSFSCS